MLFSGEPAQNAPLHLDLLHVTYAMKAHQKQGLGALTEDSIAVFRSVDIPILITHLVA